MFFSLCEGLRGAYSFIYLIALLFPFFRRVTRAMAQEVFNLSTAELALLPRLPGLDPTHTGVAGDLFNERDLQVLSNACVMHLSLIHI